MIRLVTLKGFKRFGEVSFPIPGHVVLAGPNNTGKTTLLQAIAAWQLGLQQWQQLGKLTRSGHGYAFQDLERLNFSPVAVRSFEFLWKNRQRAQSFEIGLQLDGLPLVTLEFRFKAAGLMQVRPKEDVPSEALSDPRLAIRTTFIPAMSGLARIEQRLADTEAIDSALAQGRPGEVLPPVAEEAGQHSSECDNQQPLTGVTRPAEDNVGTPTTRKTRHVRTMAETRARFNSGRHQGARHGQSVTVSISKTGSPVLMKLPPVRDAGVRWHGRGQEANADPDDLRTHRTHPLSWCRGPRSAVRTRRPPSRSRRGRASARPRYLFMFVLPW